MKGEIFRFFPHADNTGAATVKINGLTTKALVQSSGAALIVGQIKSGQSIEISYDGTAYRVLSGVTNNTVFTGTMSVSGALTAGSFVGNGAAVTNVNAASVGGIALAGLTQTSRQMIAGNGLTGGGTFAADRTIAIGTPGTITNTTTNAVTTTSHTHALTLVASDISGALGYVPSKGDGLPIGSMIMIYGNDSAAPPGFLLANGAAVTTTYPELRAFGLARGWLKSGTNPLLPDMGGYFPRGWRTGQTVDSGRTFGSVQTDAMQRIEGEVGYVANAAQYSPNGAFYAGNVRQNLTNSSGGSGSSTSFDSSRVVRTADETRPSNVTVTYWVKAYDVENTSGSINLSNVANDVTALQTNVSTLGVKRQAPVTPTGNAFTLPGIPAGVQRVTIKLSGIVQSANAQTILRLGTAGGIIATGYSSAALGINGTGSNGVSSSVAFLIGDTATDGSSPRNGVIELIRAFPGSTKWLQTGTVARPSSIGLILLQGSIDLAAELSQVQITTLTGVPTFSGANSVSIEWEF